MTLAYDISRCLGVRTSELCATCQRKQPGRPDGPQSYISPAVTAYEAVDQCRNHIPERDDRTGELFGDEHG
jgi:hypothetical protein